MAKGKSKSVSSYNDGTRAGNKDREANKKLKILQKNNPEGKYKIVTVKGNKRTGYNIVNTGRKAKSYYEEQARNSG